MINKHIFIVYLSSCYITNYTFVLIYRHRSTRYENAQLLKFSPIHTFMFIAQPNIISIFPMHTMAIFTQAYASTCLNSYLKKNNSLRYPLIILVNAIRQLRWRNIVQRLSFGYS